MTKEETGNSLLELLKVDRVLLPAHSEPAAHHLTLIELLLGSLLQLPKELPQQIIYQERVFFKTNEGEGSRLTVKNSFLVS